MKLKMLVVFAVFSVSTIACASSVRRGVVAMKLSESEAHISLGRGDDIAPGDRVVLYRNSCQRRSTPTKGTRIGCEKHRLGEGSISEILSDNYSVLQVPAGTRLQEGDLVESAGR